MNCPPDCLLPSPLTGRPPVLFDTFSSFQQPLLVHPPLRHGATGNVPISLRPNSSPSFCRTRSRLLKLAFPRHAKVLVECDPPVKEFRPYFSPTPASSFTPSHSIARRYPFHVPASKLSGNCTNITIAGPSTTRVT